jgi:hypothetical protein
LEKEAEQHSEKEMIKAEPIEDVVTPSTPTKSIAILNFVEPPPPYEHPPVSRPRSITSTRNSKAPFRSKSIRGFKKEVLKTVTVEVESSIVPVETANRPTTSMSTSTACSYVTLIWATAAKSHWQDEPIRDSMIDVRWKGSVRDGESRRDEKKQDSSQDKQGELKVTSPESGWRAPSDWDALYTPVEAFGMNKDAHIRPAMISS